MFQFRDKFNHSNSFFYFQKRRILHINNGINIQRTSSHVCAGTSKQNKNNYLAKYIINKYQLNYNLIQPVRFVLV